MDVCVDVLNTESMEKNWALPEEKKKEATRFSRIFIV